MQPRCFDPAHLKKPLADKVEAEGINQKGDDGRRSALEDGNSQKDRTGSGGAEERSHEMDVESEQEPTQGLQRRGPDQEEEKSQGAFPPIHQYATAITPFAEPPNVHVGAGEFNRLLEELKKERFRYARLRWEQYPSMAAHMRRTKWERNQMVKQQLIQSIPESRNEGMGIWDSHPRVRAINVNIQRTLLLKSWIKESQHWLRLDDLRRRSGLYESPTEPKLEAKTVLDDVQGMKLADLRVYAEGDCTMILDQCWDHLNINPIQDMDGEGVYRLIMDAIEFQAGMMAFRELMEEKELLAQKLKESLRTVSMGMMTGEDQSSENMALTKVWTAQMRLFRAISEYRTMREAYDQERGFIPPTNEDI